MKKRIFISHISEESSLAKILKDEILKRTSGMVDIFVSSDGESIEAGQEWLETIKKALRESELMIALCSKESINRSWVNFEIGAGWSKGVKVIPVCHTDLELKQLKPPISMLQGITINREDELRVLFKTIGTIVEADSNLISGGDMSDFLSKIKNFEEEYGFKEKATKLLLEFINQFPEVKDFICDGPDKGEYQVYLNQTKLLLFQESLTYLNDNNIISIEKGERSAIFGAGSGIVDQVLIKKLSNFSKINFMNS